MDFEFFRILIAILGTFILAYQDGKTSFMDEKLLYVMLGAGVIFTLLSFDVNFAMWTGLGVAVILLIGYVAYRTGQFGMGDVLLFAALHALLPVFPVAFMDQITSLLGLNVDLNFGLLFPPVFSVLLVASILGLVGSAFLYAYKLLRSGKKLKPNWKVALLSIVMCGVVFYLIAIKGISLVALFFLLVMFAAMIFTFTFKDQVTSEVLIELTPINKIEDEDILAIDKLDEKLVAKYKLDKVLTVSQVAILKEIEKKEKIHAFPVFKHLPRFGPYILAALILVLLFGNPIIAFLL